MSNREMLINLYFVGIIYGVGGLITVAWWLYRNIAYRMALGVIGWKPPLRAHDWFAMFLEAILTIIIWPYALHMLIREHRA